MARRTGLLVTAFGPDRDEVPELLHLARGVLLVQSWEAFAMQEPEGEGRSFEVVTFSGRLNKSEATTTFAIMLIEENLVALIEGLQRGLRTIQAAGT